MIAEKLFLGDDSISQYLFNKNYNELSFNEIGRFIQYNYDVDHPKWKKIEIDNVTLKYDYEVSNTGEVRRVIVPNKEYNYMNRLILQNQYVSVSLRTYGKPISKLVHRLVALAFIPNDDPENKTQVNHINGNKQCNWVGNLEWLSPLENTRHAVDTGLAHPSHGHQPHGVQSGVCNHTEEQVRKACELLEKRELSYAAIGRIVGANADFVRSLTRGVWPHITKDYNIPQTLNIFERNIKVKIRKLVKEGKSDDEIKQSFSHFYDLGNEYDDYIHQQRRKLL